MGDVIVEGIYTRNVTTLASDELRVGVILSQVFSHPGPQLVVFRDLD